MGKQTSEQAPDSRCQAKFLDYRDTYPKLSILKEHHKRLVTELDGVCRTKWREWPEKELYPDSDEWHVFPFIAFGQKIKHHCEMCPETVALLDQIPGVRTALYSRLGPQTKLQPHRGWGPLANHVLRCHYGLRVPPECGIWVDGEYMMQEQQEILVFDDSQYHIGFNFSDEERIVLLIDIERPDWVAPGTSEQGFTEDLSELLKYFSIEV